MRISLLPFFVASAVAADFPEPFNTEPATSAPMPAAQAAATMRVPAGFHVSLFAGEPDVQQPIAMATDSRGRLWVAECYTYAESKIGFDLKLRDRIVIFEDTDHDGRFDKRTVFWDQGQRLTSIELGFGGVWATCAPQLLFIPDKNGDDIPDAAPEVVLDGWDAGAIRHNVVNGLRWGPDGWLYGRHGILATSHVGAPGTPDAQRTPVNVGIWRYHPTRKVFETVASGTTNPWGMDWNEVGEAFFTNTVTGHLWHMIPGAHYQRMYGEDLTPNLYQLMPMCADHWHFDTGAGWTKSRATFDGAVASNSDSLGGGHAHCGCLIYQGEQWPAEWRGKLLTINFHGRRLNVERLERSGSGYVAKHEPDFLQSADPWFRGIDLIQSADGGVFLADWSDAGECHDNDGVHRTSGRIFKITYGESRASTPDVAKLSDVKLVEAQLSKNEWLVRTARRVAQERAARHAKPANVGELLTKGLNPDAGLSDDEKKAAGFARDTIAADADGAHRLRMLWALEAMGASDQALLRTWASDRDEVMRAWAVRILADQGAASHLRAIVASETSPFVRRAYAESLTHIHGDLGNQILGTLLNSGDIEADQNMPLLLWYQAAGLADSAPLLLTKLAAGTKLPIFQQFTARILAERMDKRTEGLTDLLNLATASASPALATNVVAGMADGLRGMRKAAKPDGWDRFAEKVRGQLPPPAQARLREIEVIFGDGRALGEIRAIALDDKAELAARRQALQSLIDARPPELRGACEALLGVRGIGSVAARGLAVFDDAAIGALLVGKYGGFQAGERSDVIGVLASRPAWARALLDAIAAGSIARGDLGAFHARQIRAFNDEALTKRLAEVWGEIRPTDDAKRELISKLKTQLTPDAVKQADPRAGRALFAQTCAVCHKLYGEGAEFGPDLTGSGRHDLSYLLENIADPSAVVPADFRLNIVTLKDGRVLSGALAAKTSRTIAVRSAGGSETIELADIAKTEQFGQSPMPEGLLLALSEAQVRDLVAYLMSDAQVPLPAAK